MYTYNKDDKSYTFSFDDLDIDSLIDSDKNEEKQKDGTDIRKRKFSKLSALLS